MLKETLHTVNQGSALKPEAYSKELPPLPHKHRRELNSRRPEHNPFKSLPIANYMVRRLLRSISSLNHWNSSRSSDIQVLPSVGILSSSTRLYNQLSPNSEIIEETEDVDDQEPRKSSSSRARRAMKEVDLESSLRYMKSNAYKITYGDAKVWMPYRRNFAGAYPPKMTRKLCIRGGMLTTGNPCPLCRDEYLVIDEKNVDLLHQFIDVHTGEVISYEKTGVCQKRHKQLVIAVLRAYDQGYLEMPVPFREYNYADYMKQT